MMVTATKEIEGRGKLASLLDQNSEKLLTCVHCGLCLPACPTYRVLGDENDSPRGRIYLMRAVVERRIEVGQSFISHIDLCLGCRGCESVCPSGVPYGHLLEAARAEVAKAQSASRSPVALIIRVVLNQVFTRPWLLRAALALARWFRDSGIARLLFDSDSLPARFKFGLALLLASRSPLANKSGGANRNSNHKYDESRPGESQRGKDNRALRVAPLHGCVMEGLFAEANRATERVLARNGCSVIEAVGQTCCGALNAHAGQLETARMLARKNIEKFMAAAPDRVIVNSAGCGAAMKEYGELLADDDEFRILAREFSSKVRDISEFLVERGIEPPIASIKRRVTYDAPCHLIHAQRIASAPVDVLKSVPGLDLVPMRGQESCCGGAGIYNLQHTDLSAEILADKILAIRETGADTVATANPGCIMQLGAGALLEGLQVDVIHPVELLDAAYTTEQPR